MFILFVLIFFGCIFLIIKLNSNNSLGSTPSYDYNDDYSEDYDEDYQRANEPRRKPKISAEIDEGLNVEIQHYCRRHSLTTSDFIRKAIRFYLDYKK